LPDALSGWAGRGSTLPPLDAIYARLTEILRELFDDDTIVARPELTAAQVDGWDSFAQLQILFEVEKSFGVTFAASQVSSLKNVGELAELIHKKA
jgi:acyl carrier protein